LKLARLCIACQIKYRQVELAYADKISSGETAYVDLVTAAGRCEETSQRMVYYSLKDTPAARAFINYLASPESALIWIKRKGFTSPNKKVPLSAYTDKLQRAAAQGLVTSTAIRFDMSDLQPVTFGGTTGQGEWKIFQDFLKKPNDVNGIAAALEAAAAKAYK